MAVISEDTVGSGDRGDPSFILIIFEIFSQKIYSLGLYELFVSPGSSTSPPLDPGRETVFTD